jgi:hypothetical protein
MILSEEALKLKQDFDDVYSAGYEKGKSEGGGSLPNSKKWVDSVYNVRLGDLTGEGETLEFDFPSVTDLSKMFADAQFNAETTHLIINFSKPITSVSEFFRRASSNPLTTLKKVTLNADLSQCKSFNYFFGSTKGLEVIDGTPINMSSSTTGSGCFYLCSGLKEVRFVEGSIKIPFYISASGDLSDESIKSIVDGLADLTGGEAKTLTLHATVKGKLTDEQIATITGKNWTIA